MISGYEVIGLENIPDTGGALVVYYHGAIPIDLFYFLSHVFLNKNRLIYTVADKFLFRIPGNISNQKNIFFYMLSLKKFNAYS